MEKNRKNYEICIVGCGIAGSTLAYNLTPDYDTCIIDKKSPERLGSKPCGNAVHKDWFSDGVDPKPRDFDAVGTEIDSLRLNLPGEKTESRLDRERKGIALDKEKYIKGSLERALDKGAEFIQAKAEPEFNNGDVRGVEANGDAIDADIFVDASGTAASLRKNYKSLSEDAFFSGYREVIDSKPEDRVWDLYLKGGDLVLWTSPLGDRTIIGGIAFQDGRRLENKIGEKKRQLGLDGEEVLESGYGILPSHRPIDLVHGNTVAIGDAGLTVNPLTGGGIGPSVKTANLLSDTLKDGGDLEVFQERYFDEVADGFKKRYFMRRVFLKLMPHLWKPLAKWAHRNYYNGGLADL